MQYCRLQSLQFPARNSFRSSSFSLPPLPAPWSSSFISSPSSSGSRADNSGHDGEGVRGRRTRLLGGELERGASSGIMVLLEKQVHLQNEVGSVCAPAGGNRVVSHGLSQVEFLGTAWTCGRGGVAYWLRRQGRGGTGGRGEREGTRGNMRTCFSIILRPGSERLIRPALRSGRWL